MGDEAAAGLAIEFAAREIGIDPRSLQALGCLADSFRTQEFARVAGLRSSKMARRECKRLLAAGLVRGTKDECGLWTWTPVPESIGGVRARAGELSSLGRLLAVSNSPLSAQGDSSRGAAADGIPASDDS